MGLTGDEGMGTIGAKHGENMHKTVKFLLAITLVCFLSCSKQSSINEPPVDSSPPLVPSDLVGIGLSSSSIGLAWVDNSDDESYFAIYKYDNINDSFFVFLRLGANITAFIDTELEDSTEYRYYVVAQKGDSSSFPSNMVSVSTLVGGMTVTGFSYFQAPGATMDLYNNFALSAPKAHAFIRLKLAIPPTPC